MSLFEARVKSEYLCPRCGQSQMFAVSRPVNVVRLYCETCESELTVEYVQGWHDARKFYAAQQSVQPTIATAALEDSPFETGIRRNAVVLSNRNSG